MSSQTFNTYGQALEVVDLCKAAGRKAYILKLNEHRYEVRAW